MIKNSILSVRRKYLVSAALVIFTLVIGYFLLQFSTITKHWGVRAYLQHIHVIYTLLNIGTLGVVLSALWIVTGRLWLSCFLQNTLCGVIAISNYYVIEFHGMPLSFLLVKNFRTAMNVISAYEFDITRPVLLMLIVSAIALVVPLMYFYALKPIPVKHRWKYGCVLLAASAVVVYTGYISDNSIIPKDKVFLTWYEPYGEYGFVARTIESIQMMVNGVNEPSGGGYSQPYADDIAIENHQTAETQMPDVIFIVNESFYDLRQITALTTDVPFMTNVESQENLLRGYAVSPQHCGGTNASEYELLTSNSMHLMPGITPFSTLNLDDANSVARFMNALGYSTMACHTENAINYSRDYGYPALGFQNSYFDTDFQNKEYYYDRSMAMDRGIYRDLIRWYEEMPEETPRFLYMLTMQNHGEYNLNDVSCDIVHTNEDYGVYTQEMNEFLTGIYLSDQAFKELVEYFEQESRPVVICMVGDHCPAFAYEIADLEDPNEDLLLRLGKTPLLMWANFPLKDEPLGTIGMNMVVPTMLDVAQMPLSPYYSYLLEMKEQVPIMSAFGCYYDVQGNRYLYDEPSVYQSLVGDYFQLEYQNIKTDKNRQIYLPYGF